LSQLDGKIVSGATVRMTATQDGKPVQESTLKEDASRPGSYLGTLEQLPAGPVKLQVAGDRVQALLAAENFRRPLRRR